jgi:hypothetical protein
VVPPLPYNADYPWVKEKLRAAPEFRPAVLVHLQVVEQARMAEWRYDARIDVFEALVCGFLCRRLTSTFIRVGLKTGL